MSGFSLKLSNISLIVLSTIFFMSCSLTLERKSLVKKKCKFYLEEKYQEEFELKAYTRDFSNMNWKYKSTMIFCPENNREVLFRVGYADRDQKITFEEYKNALWEWQIEKDLKQIVLKEFPITEVDVEIKHDMLRSSNRLDLNYFKTYKEFLSSVSDVDLRINVFIEGNITLNDSRLNCFSVLCDTLAGLPVAKNKIKVSFCNEDDFIWKRTKKIVHKYELNSTNCNQQLLFKFEKHQEVPKDSELEILVEKYDSKSIFNKDKAIYDKARLAHEKGDFDRALALYQQILSERSAYYYSYDSYIYSSFSTESAYYSAEILDSQDKKELALKYYQDIADTYKDEYSGWELDSIVEDAKMRVEKAQ